MRSRSAGLCTISTIALCWSHTARAQQADIVFACGRGGTNNICVMSATGENIRQLTFDTAKTVENLTPRWSPHHQKIAFHRRTEAGSDINTMDANGSHLQRVTTSDRTMLYRNVAWSPDGSQLAMDCGNSTATDICVAASDGTNLRKLTDANSAGGSSGSPDWSPDGSRIAFQSNRNGQPFGPRAFRSFDIYVMNADGSNVRRLTTTLPGRTTESPAWSPDGERILVASTRDAPSMLTGWQLYVMRPDGTSMQQLTRDSVRFAFGHPRWSPDGRAIVFHSNREGTKNLVSEVELYVIGADGKNMRRLTRNDVYDGFADW
jgi:tol-pal system beta propeller repeat protein TolB